MTAHLRHGTRRRLSDLTRLEDRCTPALFGVPWADPMHLSLSFAPDGTTAAGEPSQLVAALDAVMPRTIWQNAVARAAQTWTEAAGVNIGIVPDAGAPFGAPGPTQADGRFGDVRLGGFPMAANELAVAIPPDPYLTGSFAGDVFVNTRAALTPDLLYAVALHEIGHALGLPPSADPTSVMFNTAGPTRTTLSAADVAALRALYGARSHDAHDLEERNDTAKRATRLDRNQGSGNFDGSTPAVGYGDLTTRSDVDVFTVRGLDNYRGPMTVRVQTAGVSLLAPQVTVTDERGRVLGRVSGSGALGSVLEVWVPRTTPGERYFVRVEAAPGTAFAVGRFGVGVTFDARLKPTALSLDEVLRGPYETLDPGDLRALFRDPYGAIYEYDGHADDTPLFAEELDPVPGFARDTRYRTVASLSDPTDVDFFLVSAPEGDGAAAWVLTATVRGTGLNPAAPRVEVFDALMNPVPTEVLANGNGTFTVQAVGLRPDGDYYLRVFGGGTGNYELDAGFGTTPIALRTFAAGTLAAPSAVHEYALYVAQPQLFGINLSATGAAGSSATLTIADASGRVVYSLTAAAGDTTSAVSVLLPPGEYTVRVTAGPGSAGPVGYRVRGLGLSDPIGPVLDSATLQPQYANPSDPTTYLYPTGTITIDPYLWALQLTF